MNIILLRIVLFFSPFFEGRGKGGMVGNEGAKPKQINNLIIMTIMITTKFHFTETFFSNGTRRMSEDKVIVVISLSD